MKVLGIVAASVLALSFAGQSFAKDNDCPYDANGNVVAGGNGGYQKDSHGNLSKCVAAAAAETGTPAVASAPAAAGGASAGALAGGTVAVAAAVVAAAVAVAVASGNGGNTTGTTGTH